MRAEARAGVPEKRWIPEVARGLHSIATSRCGLDSPVVSMKSKEAWKGSSLRGRKAASF